MFNITAPGGFLDRAQLPGRDAIHQAFVEVLLASEKIGLLLGLHQKEELRQELADGRVIKLQAPVYSCFLDSFFQGGERFIPVLDGAVADSSQSLEVFRRPRQRPPRQRPSAVPRTFGCWFELATGAAKITAASRVRTRTRE